MPRSVSDDSILDAVVATVLEHGYAGATTRQIAANAGVNEVTLFRKFGNKANLLREAMLREFAVFEEAGGARYTGDIYADLGRVVSLYRGLVERRGGLMPILFGELGRRPELSGVIEIPHRVLHSIAEVLSRYQDEGVLEAEPPLQSVACLLAPLIIMRLGQMVPSGPTLDRLSVDDHVRRFVRGRTT